MRYSELIEITFEQTLKEAFDEYQMLKKLGLKVKDKRTGLLKLQMLSLIIHW